MQLLKIVLDLQLIIISNACFSEFNHFLEALLQGFENNNTVLTGYNLIGNSRQETDIIKTKQESKNLHTLAFGLLRLFILI